MKAYESISGPDEHPLMAALGHGLPITLLVDLVDPNGPRSLEMLQREPRRSDAAGRSRPASDEARTA